jgi:hypothetical protein
MFEYRITKYDPRFRDERGAYTRPDWIRFQDVGEIFSGAVLTREAYDAVENAYVASAISFLREVGLYSLRVVAMDRGPGNSPFSPGSVLGLDDIALAIRGLLREKYWFKLESAQAFIHIGWDFYMYVGVPRECPQSISETRRLGLFAEEFRSPYRGGEQEP